MHIAVFLQYYHTPDCPTGARPFALVERLARDHQVSVITTRTGQERRLTHHFPWSPAGVDLRMLDVPYRNAMNTPQRVRAYVSYAARAFATGLQLPAPDVIIGSSTPLTAALTAAAVAQLRGVPWIFEVRDLWPAFPIQMGAVSNPLLTTSLRALERALYHSAAHVVALSPDMHTHIQRVAPSAQTTTIPYGTERNLVDQITDCQPRRLQEQYGLPSTGIVLYAGSFGRANAIPTLIQTAQYLQDHAAICFVFAGHGYYEPLIRKAARALPNVRLLPPQPRLRSLALFRHADVSITSFIDRPVLGTNSPAKLYDSLAVGTPVIVTNPGWMQHLVEHDGCGWYVPPEDPQALARTIATLFEHSGALQAAGASAAAVARARFSREQHMDRMAEIVELVGPSS